MVNQTKYSRAFILDAFIFHMVYPSNTQIFFLLFSQPKINEFEVKVEQNWATNKMRETVHYSVSRSEKKDVSMP